MLVTPIPTFQTNYIWLIHCPGTNDAWVVDPGDDQPVIDFLNANSMTLKGILITHKHWDHVSGLPGLTARYSVPVYGPHNSPVQALTHRLREGDTIGLGRITVKVLETPGHTDDHIVYYSAGTNMLFCGDTVFSAGCGRLFDGTLEAMYDAILRIRSLPDETVIYCAHEYTMQNLEFAQAVEPSNDALVRHRLWCQHAIEQRRPTLPTTVQLEKLINPFMRCDVAEVQRTASDRVTGVTGKPFETFKVLREWKNRY